MQSTTIKSNHSSIGKALDSSMKVHGFNESSQRQQFFLKISVIFIQSLMLSHRFPINFLMNEWIYFYIKYKDEPEEYVMVIVLFTFSYFKEWQLVQLLILVILILILRAEKMETLWHFILWNPNPCLLLAIVFPKLENFGLCHCVFKINLLQVKQKVLTICLKNVYVPSS